MHFNRGPFNIYISFYDKYVLHKITSYQIDVSIKGRSYAHRDPLIGSVCLFVRSWILYYPSGYLFDPCIRGFLVSINPICMKIRLLNLYFGWSDFDEKIILGRDDSVNRLKELS